MLGKDPGQVANMPWLYYEQSPQTVYYDDELQFLVSFSPSVDPSVITVLSYYIASYTPAGVFLSFKLLTSEMILCPHSNSDAVHTKTFGVNINIGCTTNFQSFVDEYTTYIYELFLKDTNSLYRAVPILITNYAVGMLYFNLFNRYHVPKLGK